MNLIEHQLTLRSPTGDMLDVITDGYFAGLSYTLKENEPGVLDLFLPGDYDRSLLKIDGQIEIRRAVGSGSLVLEGETAFFLRKPTRGSDSNGITAITVQAFSALDLMKRRIVAYCAGSSYTDKVGIFWDDMMREVVRENYGAEASDAARNLSPWLTVQADYHWGASYSHAIPWDNVLDVLKDISDNARSKGTYATFDVVRTDVSQFEFRVFLGPRGTDHTIGTSAPVIVSQERGNLLEPSYEDDWTQEHNFIYALGAGKDEDRIVQTAQDDTRLGISPFNRQEFAQEARSAEWDEAVQAEADSALESNRPRRNFSGLISQTEGCMYGVHWNWGDIVAAEYDGLTFNCHVEAVTVEVDSNGTEIVTGQLRSSEDVA